MDPTWYRVDLEFWIWIWKLISCVDFWAHGVDANQHWLQGIGRQIRSLLLRDGQNWCYLLAPNLAALLGAFYLEPVWKKSFRPGMPTHAPRFQEIIDPSLLNWSQWFVQTLELMPIGVASKSPKICIRFQRIYLACSTHSSPLNSSISTNKSWGLWS